ncbi:MAG: D-alanyl-D-alanine carboxypeptidase family protein [Acidimicrobiia bacterium]
MLTARRLPTFALLVGLLGGAAALPGPVAGAAPGDPALPPTKAWILVDADSGQVLAGESHHLAVPPASTQKLMTALVAIEQLPADATFTVGEVAAAQPAMRIGMQAGQQWPLDEALHSLMMVSANDAAYALAEAASGSLGDFAGDMNAAAARYGMRDSTFNDPAGFDDSASFNGGSLASAYDLAVAARNYLSVPLLREVAALPYHRFDGPGRAHRLRNHNKLLARYDGAIGLKTGYTRRAGHTFVGAARRDGRTMIAVVLDSDDIYGATAALLDHGFATPEGDRGIGEQLPPVRVRPYREPVPAVPAVDGTDGASEQAAGPEGRAAGASGSGSGWLDRIAVAFTGAVAVMVGLRRRALRRQRARRERRRRSGERRAADLSRAFDPEGWDAGCRVQMVREYELL